MRAAAYHLLPGKIQVVHSAGPECHQIKQLQLQQATTCSHLFRCGNILKIIHGTLYYIVIDWLDSLDGLAQSPTSGCLMK